MPQITANGISIYYESHGKGHPLLFVSAGGLDTSSWDAQVDYFSDKYQVITYDLRGHGRTSITEGSFTVKDCVDDLQHLIDGLGIQQTYLAGISMGAYITISYTLRCPEKVTSLILAAANSGPLTDGVIKLAEEMAQKMGTIKLGTGAFNAMRTYESNIGRPDLTGRLSEIEQPVLLLVGELDEASPAYVSEKMHGILPNSQLRVLSGCGHLCNQEQPDIYNTIVGDFLQRIEAG